MRHLKLKSSKQFNYIKLFMKHFIVSIIIFYCTNIFSQIEEIGPLKSNYSIFNQYNNSYKIKSEKKIETFDSTFIYISDTLTLPVFDEFSSNKYQKYTSSFNDVGITSIIKYQYLNNSTLLPISKTEKYSSQVTYRRVYSIDHLSYTDQPFTSIPIKKGNLQSYPVSYSNIEVYPAYYIYDSLENVNDKSDTIWLNSPDIIQDSARQFFKNITDPNSLWLDNYTYHNYRFALKPWSIGVATFDGIDENGKAYALGTNITNYADYLTSKPINLSGYTVSDSLYLSFLYQSGGFGEEPDQSDSLVLEFYEKDKDQWVWVWGDKGTNDKRFKVGHINLKNSQYFKKDFQFRFKNYGNLSGGFDIFNIDYIHLRTLSGKEDTLFKDYSWVYPIKSLIKEYTSVPWDHYKNHSDGKMSDKVSLDIRNGSNIAENNSTNGKIEIFYENKIEGSFIVSGSSLSGGVLNYEPRTFYSTLHDFSGGYKFNTSISGTKATFKIKGTIGSQFPNFNQNDSTFSEQYFGNYYSYDDGTAEAAYGIIGAQSDLAIKFTPYESDSLIGIMTNFVESGNNVTDKLFLLTVWSDNNGIPGEILYKDDIYFPRSPKYSSGINNYYTYYFNNNQKLKIDGNFYIGWNQFSADRLNIGFDKNNINNDKCFISLNNGITWANSSVEGTVMMRPIYSTAMDSELGLNEIKNDLTEFSIYPNPTNNYLTIKHNSKEFYGVEIYNIQGKLILTSKDEEIDLSNNPAGIYFLKLIGLKTKNQKIIKY